MYQYSEQIKLEGELECQLLPKSAIDIGEIRELVLSLVEKTELNNKFYTRRKVFQRKLVNTAVDIVFRLCRKQNNSLLLPLYPAFYSSSNHKQKLKYVESYYTYDSVQQALFLLEEFGIVYVIKGDKKFRPNGYYFKPGDLYDSPGFMTTIVLNDKKFWNLERKIKPKRNSFINDGNANRKLASESIRRKTEKINRYFKLHVNKSFNKEQIQYRRIFSEPKASIKEEFNLEDRFGRYYSDWQNIKSSHRKRILPANWEEVDFKSFLPNCMYMIRTGEKYVGKDIYSDVLDCLNLHHSYRGMMKKIMMVVINSSHRGIALHSIGNVLYENKLSRNFTSAKILEAVYSVHNRISIFFCSGIAANLLNLESEIITDTILHLSQFKNPVKLLSLHDAVFCHRKDKFYLEKLLDHFLYKHVLIFTRLIQIKKRINKREERTKLQINSSVITKETENLEKLFCFIKKNRKIRAKNNRKAFYLYKPPRKVA